MNDRACRFEYFAVIVTPDPGGGLPHLHGWSVRRTEPGRYLCQSVRLHDEHGYCSPATARVGRFPPGAGASRWGGLVSRDPGWSRRSSMVATGEAPATLCVRGTIRDLASFRSSAPSRPLSDGAEESRIRWKPGPMIEAVRRSRFRMR
jgi:hypothetical protein